ncbi:hypothetical protein S1OALGB6SA_1474 [Olavius algarvensis spirochete endosymbiont]|nr:MAG: hypothetical protein [Olavius algarvensis spirochete endosymbiont]VDB00396.1 hypothetical protein S1OALGB6SA_1474 [Olavius algarvensis spirochete endosymbiont]
MSPGFIRHPSAKSQIHQVALFTNSLWQILGCIGTGAKTGTQRTVQMVFKSPIDGKIGRMNPA